MERRTLRLRRDALTELSNASLHEVVGGLATAATLCCWIDWPTDDYTVCVRCSTDVAP